jgi:phosphohistidine phosphatase
MHIYLVQHGAAAAKEVDPERPLTEAGRDDVAAVARVLAEAGLTVPSIAHSGKLRAEQTAEILAARLRPETAVAAMKGLDPKDPVTPLAKDLSGRGADLMLVGHQPFMGRLAARLVNGDEDLAVVTFVPGAVLCLESGNKAVYSVEWMLPPQIARAGLRAGAA